MAPLVLALQRQPGPWDVRVCVTGQHRQMLDPVLTLFGIRSHYDLDIMRAGQDLTDVTVRVLTGMRQVLSDWRPDYVLVHGDTTTTLAAALAAYYARVPVAHVEAGLRTGDVYSPWPEEVNRHAVAVMAALHFAPTERARTNLLRENVAPAAIVVTGNTVIDALQWVSARLDQLPVSDAISRLPLVEGRRLILVTGHRRENFGEGFEHICRALDRLARRADVQIVYPVHLNPNVQGPVRAILSGNPNVVLCDPLDYLDFVALMRRAHLLLTDSGGLQEEAPALGKPVLVMRTVTERPEAIEAGTAQLVGTDEATIVEAATRLLDDPAAYATMAGARNPFGDGHAAERIVAELMQRLTTGHIA